MGKSIYGTEDNDVCVPHILSKQAKCYISCNGEDGINSLKYVKSGHRSLISHSFFFLATTAC